MQTRRKDHHSWRNFKSALISGLTFCSAVLVIAPLGLVFFHVLKSGAGAVNLEFFAHLPKPVGVAGGGMANAIVGTLALIMIPLILRTTEEVILLVPVGYREAALALGIARWKTIVFVVVKTASRGLITGILLALARVGGETAPLLFTAFGNRFWNHDLSEPIAALPLQIFTYAISPYDDWHRQAWAGALVLVTGVFCVNILVRLVTRVRTASA